MSEHNIPAFPRPLSERHTGPNEFEFSLSQKGMTMRQYYKAAMLQGWAAGRNHGDISDHRNSKANAVAISCGRYADAMLAEDEEHAKK